MFKQLSIYTVTSGWPASLTALEAALQRLPFAPGGGAEEKVVGWVPPRGQAHGVLAESVGGQWLLRLMVQTRQVPSAVIQRKVEEACAAIEASTGRKPGRRERRELKEQAKAALLPQAFAREQATWVWLDPERQRLLLDSTASSRCDDILTALTKVLDGFAPAPLQTATAPATAMALWLSEQHSPAGFAVGQECELKAADQSRAVVRYSRHPLLNDEIRAHIAQGKQPTRLALHWGDRVRFVLTDALKLKKIAFEDHVLEQAKAQDQRADDFDGSVLMATTELAHLLHELIDALDGLASD